MKYSLHSIHEIEPPVLASVARLHETAMGLLLTAMGPAFVFKYFETAAKDPDVIGFCALADTNRAIGYIVGTPRPDRLNSQLTRPLTWFALQCFRLAFSRPRVLWQALVSSSSQGGQMPRDGRAIELVYVAVDPQCRGLGVGRALMQAFQDDSRAAGYRSVLASQELDNEASIRLFTAMGYRVVSRYREGRYERQRVELVLTGE